MALTFATFANGVGDRMQALIRYEGFRFLMAGSELGSLLGFPQDVPGFGIRV